MAPPQKLFKNIVCREMTYLMYPDAILENSVPTRLNVVTSRPIIIIIIIKSERHDNIIV